MDPDTSERFEESKLRLSAEEEKTIAQDKSLSAIRNLLQRGIRLVVTLEEKLNMLADSHTRLYGTMQELAEAQKRTEETLKRFLGRNGG